jgi:hypothetical protein
LSFDPIGKPKYMNDNMFVMCHIGKYELALVIDVDEIRVNNKMHVIGLRWSRVLEVSNTNGEGS